MPFRNPIVSGTQLVRSAIESANFVSGLSGWAIFQNGNAEFNSIMIRGAEVVDSVLLIYNGTPATGNLIVSISPSSGVDPFGNNYVAGVVAYDNIGDFIAQSNGGNVGWGFHLNGLATDGQFGMFATGSAGAQQGMIEIEPPTGSANGPPILVLASESFDSSQPGYAALNNTDTVRLSPQTAAETVLEYINSLAVVTGWGAVSDQSVNRHFHAGTYSGTTTGAGLLTFAHGCGFTPALAFYQTIAAGAATQIQEQSLGAANAQVAFWGPTGVLRATVAVTFRAFFLG